MSRGVVVSVVVLLALAGCRSGSGEPHPVAPASAAPPGGPAAARTGEATLLLMADVRGVLRPCGCTVDLQKGGFDRLSPFLAEQRARFPGAALVHAGPMFFEDASVEAEKAAQRARQAEVVADLVARVKVDVAGVAAADVVASGGRLPALVERAHLGVTAANLAVEGARLDVSPWVVRQVGDLRVGLFALADPAAAGDGAAAKVSDPAAAARRAVAELAAQADVIVLLSELGLRDTKRLVRAVPGIHFAVAGGLGDHPSWSEEAERVGDTRVVQLHREGRYVARLTVRLVAGSAELADASAPSEAELAALDQRIARLEEALRGWEGSRSDGDDQVQSARHHLGALKDARDRYAARQAAAPADRSSFSLVVTPLEWDLPQDPDILALMDAFNEELKRINLAHAGSLPEPKPGEAVYVGVAACLECHEEATAFWEHDRHHEAWATLEELGKTFDAECVSCHVTGYGKAGGSLVGRTAGRENVQCEACHGAGSLHAEMGEALETLHVPPTAEVCTGCHNKHHSPTFDFTRYRARLVVPGHGLPLAGKGAAPGPAAAPPAGAAP